MLYKFRCAVARFMYGRSGMDQMNQALLRGYLVILVAQLIFSLLRLWIPARICESLLWVLMVFILFRMFSKNLTKRRAENQKFMGWIWKARNNAAGAKARRADKEHKYFTCPKCGKKTLKQRKFHKEACCKEAKYGLPEGRRGRPKSRN